MIRIGVRAHDFGRLPADELAAKIADKGLTCVQLAVGKAIAGVDIRNGSLNPGLAWTIGKAFEKRGVQIAVLGCYINPIHPDAQTRRQLVALFKEHLRYARDFGCSIVGLETGSVNGDYSPHPDNSSDRAFDHMLATFGLLVSEAEKLGMIVGIEGVTSHVVSTPTKMRIVLDNIKSNNLQVIFDPVNFIDGRNYLQQESIMQQSFELFGNRIAIIHAKDFAIEDDRYKQVRTGKGSLNYDLLMKWLKEHKPGISILLEESTPETVGDCIRYITSAAGA